MKKYLLFSFYEYQSEGGWLDFRGSFNTIKECKENFNLKSYISADYIYQIVDVNKLKIIEKETVRSLREVK